MTEPTGFEWLYVDGIAALVRPGSEGTVVIVPGAMADAQGWLPFANALQTSLSVAIVNRRGRAPSGDFPPDATVAAEVDDLCALVSHLPSPIILVGWSYGGLLALEAALRLDTTASIILYEPVSRPFAPAAVRPLRQLIEAGNLDRAVEYIITEVSGTPSEEVAALRQTPAWDHLKPLAASASTELAAIDLHCPDYAAYAALGIPITILIGSRNKDVDPYGTAANRFVDALPDANVATLPEQGHLAHVEAPLLLAQVIGALLRASNGQDRRSDR